MTRRYIPVEAAAKEWMKDPAFVSAYHALEDEFALTSALIKERDDAHPGEEPVAEMAELVEEYERLKRRDRRVISAGELTEAEVALIAAAEVSAGHAHLDDEIAHWRP